MDVLSSPLNAHCPVAHALEVLGQKWTFLILREAMQGRTRFADFRSIGVPSEVLTTRLSALVEANILTKRDYQDVGKRTRAEYVLTDVGRDAAVILGALGAWGLQHCEGTRPQPKWVDGETGSAATVGFIVDGEPIDARRVELVSV
ncbi:winged helix-turn-helix transcriptional regulator [Acidipropionibacterium virtanenii]|uniref:Putative HTH-type transcriptional regulator n=1 Tax=Acidipropionibacterium virtanenii TaxID=2057246 RepID=A0A344UWV2_9ACTN|nr:helix-turn-helix domain-containing protein [Acidipropionibacterium virtanenii]AXE39750.1 putative HTH-type transcriptional regulator [Acidipropionibacterium virtanenii]